MMDILEGRMKPLDPKGHQKSIKAMAWPVIGLALLDIMYDLGWAMGLAFA